MPKKVMLITPPYHCGKYTLKFLLDEILQNISIRSFCYIKFIPFKNMTTRYKKIIDING